jgi:hypothetical protein
MQSVGNGENDDKRTLIVDMVGGRGDGIKQFNTFPVTWWYLMTTRALRVVRDIESG